MFLEDRWEEIIIGVVAAVLVALLFFTKNWILTKIRLYVLRRSRKAYQYFEGGIRKEAKYKPEVNQEVIRPSWDNRKQLSAGQINNLKRSAEEVFGNFNCPEPVALPLPQPTKKKKRIAKRAEVDQALSNHYSFHLSDDFKYHAICKSSRFGMQPTATKKKGASVDVINWTRENFQNGRDFSVGFMTGPVSVGKSTLITTVCEKLNSKIMVSRKLRKPTLSETLPIYLNFNNVIDDFVEVAELEEGLPPSRTFAFFAAAKILEANNIYNINDEELINAASDCLKKNYGRLLIFIDSLDQFYYRAVMEELQQETPDTLPLDKYEIYISKIVSALQELFKIRGGYSSIDLVLAIRSETLTRIRSTGIVSPDVQPLNGISAQAEWNLGDDHLEKREEEIILGRLNLLKKTKNLPTKAVDHLTNLENEIKNSADFFEHFNRGVSVGLGLNEQRDLMHKVRCIGWSVFDQRFGRIFGRKDTCLIHYMLNQNLGYTQADTHLMNLFLVWNDSRRQNPNIGYGLTIPMKLRAFHLPSYWLKYIVLKLISVNTDSGAITKWGIENILVGEGKNSYEKHLVQLVLFSLQETTHGRFVRRAMDPDTSKFNGLELTSRGTQFIRQEISFDMHYLALVSEDESLAIPPCFNYRDWFPKVRYKKFLYERGDQDYRESYCKYILVSLGKALSFLHLLKTAALWEKRAFNKTFDRIGEYYPNEFRDGKIVPSLSEVEQKMISFAKSNYEELGGEEMQFSRNLVYTRRKIGEQKGALNYWFGKMYGRFLKITSVEFNTSLDLMTTGEFEDKNKS